MNQLPILDSRSGLCYRCPSTLAELTIYAAVQEGFPRRLYVSMQDVIQFLSIIFPDFAKFLTTDRILGYAKKVEQGAHPPILVSLITPTNPGRPDGATTCKKTMLCSFVSAMGAIDTWSIDLHSESYHQRLNPIRDLLRRSEFNLTLSFDDIASIILQSSHDDATLALDGNDNQGT